MFSYKLFLVIFIALVISVGYVNSASAEQECAWIKGGGGSTCKDAGYPIIATLAVCQDKIGDPPGMLEVCCCRNKVVDDTTSGNVDDDTTSKNIRTSAAWNITGLTNPVRTIKPAEVIGRVVRAILLIIGSIALIIFIYGGFTWMTAAGNDAKITQAKNTLVWATLGLVIIFAAYLLVKYVMEAVGVV